MPPWHAHLLGLRPERGASLVSPRLSKRLSLLGPVVFAALAMIAWTQPWAHLVLDVEGTSADITASGSDASLPVMALSLAALAGTAAMAMAQRSWRLILAILLVLLGAGIAVTASLAYGDPAAGLLAPVGEATAIGGENAIRQVIATGEVSGTAWPLIAAIGGVGVALSGAFAAITSRSWASGGRRFDRDASSEQEADEAVGDTRVSQWDALSAGDDPTDEESPTRQVD